MFLAILKFQKKCWERSYDSSQTSIFRERQQVVHLLKKKKIVLRKNYLPFGLLAWG